MLQKLLSFKFDHHLGYLIQIVNLFPTYLSLALRLHPQSHYPVYREKRESCVWCRFQYMTEHGDKSPRSNMWCTVCNIPLCINKQRPDCFISYHEHK